MNTSTNHSDIPCINCITLAVYKACVLSNSHINVRRIIVSTILPDKCSLIRRYITHYYDTEGYYLTDYSKIEKILTFLRRCR